MTDCCCKPDMMEDFDKPKPSGLEPAATEGAPGVGQMEDFDKPKPSGLEPAAIEGAKAGEGQMEEPKV
jgi:hypothetical protein